MPGTDWDWIQDAASDKYAAFAQNPWGVIVSAVLLAATAGWLFVMWRRFVKGWKKVQPEARRARVLWMGIGSATAVVLWVLFGSTFWETVAARKRNLGWMDRGPWHYHGEFHACIASADRIVVRNGGFTCCTSRNEIRKQSHLFEVSDPDEIHDVSEHLVFLPAQDGDACLCCGYPGVDWYRGQKRLALTSIQHGRALRWDGFPGDGALTEDSSTWLVSWLSRHGVDGPRKDVEERRARIEGNRKGRAELERLASARFLEAYRWIWQEKKARSQAGKEPVLLTNDEKLAAVRRAYGPTEDPVPDLFRVMGCLTMDWEKTYWEQLCAQDMLTTIPTGELLAAFRSARRSEDPVVCRGAARILYSTSDGEWKTLAEEHLNALRTEFADEAFADPLPCNRRLVLHALLKYKVTEVPEILETALTDDDQTVRRRGMALLVMRGDDQAARLLQKVIDGDLQPRPAPPDLPTDWGACADNQAEYRGLAEDYPDTDAEAARKALATLQAK